MVPGLLCSLPCSAAPYAPIKPAISGRTTSTPISFSKARNTASLQNVPPCTTIFLPSCSGLEVRITLYNAFLTTEMERPAEIQSKPAPSFCACLTLEFINTVQRLPRSTGCFAKSASCAKFLTLQPRASENVCKNDPQPDEQASFKKMSEIAPFSILKHFIS